MKPFVKPILQARFGGTQIHRSHSNLRKSQFSGPLANFGEKLIAALHDPLIVENLTWKSEDDTRLFAQHLAKHPMLRNAVIELQGDLGAGKTTCVRHLLQALGVPGRIKSPTYAVVEPYEVNGLHISHFDFYRFSDPREWEDAGFRDIFSAPGLKLLEWPDKARAVLPTPDLVIDIGVQADNVRRVTLRAFTTIGKGLLV